MAEIEIKDLLDRINREGVKKAEEESAAIISAAESKAASIISEAKIAADAIRKDAEKEADVFRKQAELSVKQAASSAALDLKAELNLLIAAVVHKGLKSSLDANAICSLIREAIRQKPDAKLAAELSDAIVEAASSQLANEIKSGLEIKVNGSVKSGFRLVEKDGSGYYDFTDRELMNVISPYLTSSVNKVIKG